MRKIFKKLAANPRTHWQWYKDLFQITVFKYLVTWFAIVPFFALLLKNIPGEIKIDILHTSIEYSLNLNLPFNWKLLWLSSLFFVIAYFLYLTCCPRLVKKYNSYNGYSYMNHSPRWVIWEAKNIFKNKREIDKFFNRISIKKYIEKISIEDFEKIKGDYNQYRKEGEDELIDYGVIIEEKQTKLYFKYNDDACVLGLPVLKDNEVDELKTRLVEKELFWEIFGRYSATHPVIRLLILVLLVFSLILFSIVFVQNICAGFKYLLF